MVHIRFRSIEKGSSTMNAEIISVGTELLLGHTVNTDTTIV